MRHAGSGGWSGLCNTHFWVDHEAGVTGSIFCQLLPFWDHGADALYTKFERAIYASLEGIGS
jgi:methyl acetate hydrolase